MDIVIGTRHLISPESLAKCLWESQAEEFAAFWFAFAKLCEEFDDGGANMDRFARMMAPRFGCARQKPLRELVRLMDFHAENQARGAKAADE